MRTVVIAHIILHFFVGINAVQLERLEEVECKQNEFYYAPREICKSCSDLRILFYGGHQEEWSNGDAINLNKIPTSGGADSHRIQLSKPVLEVEPSRFGSAGREVLSKLIGVDELQGGAAQSYSIVAQEAGSELADSSSDEEQTIGAKAEEANPLRSETLAAQRFVDGFITSDLVREELLSSIEQCKYFQNSSACQLWSNLCVMSFYSHSSNLVSSTRATTNNLFKGTSSGRSIRKDSETSASDGDEGQWWQQCGNEFNRYTICDSLRSWWRSGGSSISREMSNIFSSSDEEGLSIKIAGSNPSLRLNQPIQLLAYKYSLHGKFIGVDQFGLEQMEKFCLLSSGVSSARLSQQDNNFFRVGRNLKMSCRFNKFQAQLLVGLVNETVFVDLYMVHQLNGAVFAKPVPVLIRNVFYNGILVNQHKYTDTSRLKVVHRFFLSSLMELKAGEQVLVYANSVNLDIKFKAHERGAQLISMVLVLEYSQMPLTFDLKLSQKNSTTPNTNHLFESETNIVIAQTLVDMARYKMDFELTLTILSIVSCIWSLLKSYHILRYHGLVKMDVYSLIRFLFVSCDTLANLIATCTFIFIGFLFFAFKLQQNTIHVLAPDQELDESILTNIKLALLFKALGLLCKMYDLLNLDLFFIDWEKPKMLTSAEIQNHLSYYSKQEGAAASHDLTSHRNTLDPRLSGDQHKELSFWRPYAVVDRWLQLQTMRRESLALQLILFSCLNELSGLTELSKTEPEWNVWRRRSSIKPADSDRELLATVSSSYRLLILATVYLLVAVAQIVWHKYLYQTMIRDKVHEFIDLCSIGNVSLFCMLYPRFGYYVHGRNVNGSGECSISEMNGLLEREERGLCSRRGLAPNTDEQVFILILPRLINDHYRKLLYQYQYNQQQQQQQQQHLSSMLNNIAKNPTNDRHTELRGDLFDSNFFRSALGTAGLGPQTASYSSNRALVESIESRKRVINVFLTNFLEHHYKDIDYSIRKPRRFETFLSDSELETEMVNSRLGVPKNLPAVVIGGQEAAITNTKPTPATFFEDTSNSFTSVLWMGLEWDLVLTELLCLLILDTLLKQSLFISSILLYSLHWLLKRFYQVVARRNLTFKALIDDKFLLKT